MLAKLKVSEREERDAISSLDPCESSGGTEGIEELLGRWREVGSAVGGRKEEGGQKVRASGRVGCTTLNEGREVRGGREVGGREVMGFLLRESTGRLRVMLGTTPPCSSMGCKYLGGLHAVNAIKEKKKKKLC